MERKSTQLDVSSAEKDKEDNKGQVHSMVKVKIPQDLKLSKEATHEDEMIKKTKPKEKTPSPYTQKVPFP